MILSVCVCVCLCASMSVCVSASMFACLHVCAHFSANPHVFTSLRLCLHGSLCVSTSARHSLSCCQFVSIRVCMHDDMCGCTCGCEDIAFFLPGRIASGHKNPNVRSNLTPILWNDSMHHCHGTQLAGSPSLRATASPHPSRPLAHLPSCQYLHGVSLLLPTRLPEGHRGVRAMEHDGGRHWFFRIYHLVRTIP